MTVFLQMMKPFSHPFHQGVLQVQKGQILLTVQKPMVVKVAGILALVHRAHPPIAKAEADQIHLDILCPQVRSRRIGNRRRRSLVLFLLVDEVGQSWNIFPSI